MTQNLIGRWKGGWALDLHTVSSKINPDGSYDNVRSKIGEALYLLKYRNDNSQIDFLVNELVEFFSVHDKFHRTLILSGFCLLKIAKISLNSSFFPKPIKR